MQWTNMKYALASILLLLLAVRGLAQDSPAAAPQSTIGDPQAKLQLAEVTVTSAGAQPMREERKWAKLPAYLDQAQIYDHEPTGRALDLTIKSDGIVLIAASWSYDGNESGGWLEGRTSREELVATGWVPLADVVSTDKGDHTLFVRAFKAGDKVKLHTRKYNQPFVVIPAAEKVADVHAAIAQAKVKQAPPKEMAKVEASPMPGLATAPAPTELSVPGAEPLVIDPQEWSPLPEYMQGATILRPSNSNVLSFTVHEETPVFIAASWAYDGNRSGGWYEGRTTLSQMQSAGWTVLATIVNKDKGEHLLLRRTIKPGQYKFHTRKHNPPAILVPQADLLPAAIAGTGIVAASNDLRSIHPAEPRPAQSSGRGVVLRRHEADLDDRFAERGILLRELVRQAVLLTAREELGLPTRDDVLRERGMPGNQTSPEPLDCIVKVVEGGRANITLFRFKDGKPDVLWDKQIVIQGKDPILALTEEAERLSRTEFIAALNKAEYGGKANPILERGARTQLTHAALTDLHPLPQFAAARELHQSLRTQGESPQSLADLARVYANLGVLTEHLLYPAHKTFKARSLLYAERGVSRWPKSPVARAGRAYARALTGLHQGVIDDLSIVALTPGLDRLEESAEVPLLASFCRFELAQIDEGAVARRNLPLLRLLRLLSLERSAGTERVVQAANELLQSVADSDRAADAIAATDHLGTRSEAVELALTRTPQALHTRLLKLEDLPRRAATIAEEAATETGGAERTKRLALIRELRTAGDVGADAGEPSWQAVAAWMEEVAFQQANMQAELMARGFGVGADEAIAEHGPLLVDHPYAAYFASLTENRPLRRAKLAEAVPAIQLADVSSNEVFMWRFIAGNAFDKEGDQFDRLAFQHQDWVYRDLLYTLRRSREIAWTENATHLRRVSPYSPQTIAATVEYDWEYAAPRAADWERQYIDSPQVQGALGRQYLKQEKYAEAVRCLRRQVKDLPEIENYEVLAKAFLAQRNEPQWLATWNEFLQQEDFGLDHARARANIAEHYMAQGKWEAAWPYAEASANSGAEWAMVCAADCLTGLKRWDEAEEYVESSSRRYPPTASTWYLWCRRHGKGNEAGAAAYVREVMSSPHLAVNTVYRGMFYVASGDKAKALAHYRESLSRGASPVFAWQAALLADELKQTEVRDASLNLVNPSAVKYGRIHLGTLADFAREALADESNFATFPAKVTELLKGIEDPRERCQTAYLAGRLLLQHGHAEAGRSLLKEAAAVPFSHHAATLAAISLRED